MEEDQRTMVLIRNIANSIHPMLQFEEDFCSRYPDKKLPILDLKCWLDQSNELWHEHYEKPVATRKVLHSKSALAWGTKRNVAVEECVRRLRNCSPDLQWE